MHLEKNKIPYIFLVLLCTVYIPFVLWPFFKQDNASVYVNISIYDIFLIFLGLIFMGIAVWIILNIWKYHIGKTFSLYLFCVSTGILMHFLPGTYPTYTNGIVFSLLCISNVFLYRIICQITNSMDSRLYKILELVLIIVTIVHSLLFVIDIPVITNSSLLTSNYLLATVCISVVLIYNYRRTAGYLKKQILSILRKLALGLVLFVFTGFLSVLELNIQTNVAEDHEVVSEYFHRTENRTASDEQRLNVLPVIIYAFVIISILYMLVKKEYLAELSGPKLSRLLLIIVLFWLFDFCILLMFLPEIGKLCLLNSFLAAASVIPWQKKESFHMESTALIEEEQQRISALLHDDILQSIFALKNKISNDKKTDADIQYLITKVRGLSNDLHPLVVENLGLDMSLNMLVKDFAEHDNVAILYENDSENVFLTLARETSLYRFAKEFIANAVKHAACTEIKVRLCVEGNLIKLIVKDNGNGIEMDNAEQKWINEHTGLRTIDKRAAQLGGVLKIHSAKERGTECSVELPLEEK